MNIRTYDELCKLETFEERFEYLKLEDGHVGVDTFGHLRYLNQKFYQSKEWKDIRNKVIVRDNGCDLGIDGYEIVGENIVIHHLNPLTSDDIINRTEYLTNPRYLISTRLRTHNAIHYGDLETAKPIFAERSKNDTCPWKRI